MICIYIYMYICIYVYVYNVYIYICVCVLCIHLIPSTDTTQMCWIYVWASEFSLHCLGTLRVSWQSMREIVERVRRESPAAIVKVTASAWQGQDGLWTIGYTFLKDTSITCRTPYCEKYYMIYMYGTCTRKEAPFRLSDVWRMPHAPLTVICSVFDSSCFSGQLTLEKWQLRVSARLQKSPTCCR